MGTEPGALVVVTEICAGTMAILNDLPEMLTPPPPPPPPPPPKSSSHDSVYGPSYNMYNTPKLVAIFRMLP